MHLGQLRYFLFANYNPKISSEKIQPKFNYNYLLTGWLKQQPHPTPKAIEHNNTHYHICNSIKSYNLTRSLYFQAENVPSGESIFSQKRPAVRILSIFQYFCLGEVQIQYKKIIKKAKSGKIRLLSANKSGRDEQAAKGEVKAEIVSEQGFRR